MLGGLACIAFDASPCRAQGLPLQINVRATVDARDAKISSANAVAEPASGRGRTFAIYPAVEMPSLEKILKPLTPAAVNRIYGLVQTSLEARGYLGAKGNEKPEVMITVQYGRGLFNNPYRNYQDTGEARGAALGTDAGGISPYTANGPMVSVTGLPDLKRFEPAHEAKLQAANEDKLFLMVTAWNVASLQKGRKPLRLWQTSMLVDDPDHRDLNQVYEKMLAAGGEYFDRKIVTEEVEISTEPSAGKVKVGTPRVMEDGKPVK